MCLFRKRKPLAREREKGSHVVKMTWDMDTESTNALMEDMGVSVLEDDDELLEYEPKPTPVAPSITDLIPPGVSIPNISSNIMVMVILFLLIIFFQRFWTVWCKIIWKGKVLDLAASLTFALDKDMYGKDVQYVNDVTCIATVKQTVSQNCFNCRFVIGRCPWLPSEWAGSDTHKMSNHQGFYRISKYVMDVFYISGMRMFRWWADFHLFGVIFITFANSPDL